ncbi:hypothetical protein H696_03974 [Fonticula alba]|uniref:Uncharacterized protein n=1 Tax=Fonticula alba TaxID=691883 RepID=A0A058Z6L7_FONAL|nr:hypothetical protein H696_03974 [Fonticula alba]KCV69553.1 hypothetical protein H696_03974 [Fonticula alba]|eukprot:XP_009496118.1 hypothetical protein H696_03974 [Fonticula alba]
MVWFDGAPAVAPGIASCPGPVPLGCGQGAVVAAAPIRPGLWVTVTSGSLSLWSNAVDGATGGGGFTGGCTPDVPELWRLYLLDWRTGRQLQAPMVIPPHLVPTAGAGAGGGGGGGGHLAAGLAFCPTWDRLVLALAGPHSAWLLFADLSSGDDDDDEGAYGSWPGRRGSSGPAGAGSSSPGLLGWLRRGLLGLDGEGEESASAGRADGPASSTELEYLGTAHLPPGPVLRRAFRCQLPRSAEGRPTRLALAPSGLLIVGLSCGDALAYRWSFSGELGCPGTGLAEGCCSEVGCLEPLPIAEAASPDSSAPGASPFYPLSPGEAEGLGAGAAPGPVGRAANSFGFASGPEPGPGAGVESQPRPPATRAPPPAAGATAQPPDTADTSPPGSAVAESPGVDARPRCRGRPLDSVGRLSWRDTATVLGAETLPGLLVAGFRRDPGGPNGVTLTALSGNPGAEDRLPGVDKLAACITSLAFSAPPPAHVSLMSAARADSPVVLLVGHLGGAVSIWSVSIAGPEEPLPRQRVNTALLSACLRPALPQKALDGGGGGPDGPPGLPGVCLYCPPTPGVLPGQDALFWNGSHSLLALTPVRYLHRGPEGQVLGAEAALQPAGAAGLSLVAGDGRQHILPVAWTVPQATLATRSAVVSRPGGGYLVFTGWQEPLSCTSGLADVELTGGGLLPHTAGGGAAIREFLCRGAELAPSTVPPSPCQVWECPPLPASFDDSCGPIQHVALSPDGRALCFTGVRGGLVVYIAGPSEPVGFSSGTWRRFSSDSQERRIRVLAAPVFVRDPRCVSSGAGTPLAGPGPGSASDGPGPERTPSTRPEDAPPTGAGSLPGSSPFYPPAISWVVVLVALVDEQPSLLALPTRSQFSGLDLDKHRGLLPLPADLLDDQRQAGRGGTDRLEPAWPLDRSVRGFRLFASHQDSRTGRLTALIRRDSSSIVCEYMLGPKGLRSLSRAVSIGPELGNIVAAWGYRLNTPGYLLQTIEPPRRGPLSPGGPADGFPTPTRSLASSVAGSPSLRASGAGGGPMLISRDGRCLGSCCFGRTVGSVYFVDSVSPRAPVRLLPFLPTRFGVVSDFGLVPSEMAAPHYRPSTLSGALWAVDPSEQCWLLLHPPEDEDWPMASPTVGAGGIQRHQFGGGLIGVPIHLPLFNQPVVVSTWPVPSIVLAQQGASQMLHLVHDSRIAARVSSLLSRLELSSFPILTDVVKTLLSDGYPSQAARFLQDSVGRASPGLVCGPGPGSATHPLVANTMLNAELATEQITRTLTDLLRDALEAAFRARSRALEQPHDAELRRAAAQRLRGPGSLSDVLQFLALFPQSHSALAQATRLSEPDRWPLLYAVDTEATGVDSLLLDPQGGVASLAGEGAPAGGPSSPAPAPAPIESDFEALSPGPGRPDDRPASDASAGNPASRPPPEVGTSASSLFDSLSDVDMADDSLTVILPNGCDCWDRLCPGGELCFEHDAQDASEVLRAALASGRVSAAASLLLVVRDTCGSGAAISEAFILLDASLEVGDFACASQVVKFLRDMAKSGLFYFAHSMKTSSLSMSEAEFFIGLALSRFARRCIKRGHLVRLAFFSKALQWDLSAWLARFRMELPHSPSRRTLLSALRRTLGLPSVLDQTLCRCGFVVELRRQDPLGAPRTLRTLEEVGTGVPEAATLIRALELAAEGKTAQAAAWAAHGPGLGTPAGTSSATGGGGRRVPPAVFPPLGAWPRPATSSRAGSGARQPSPWAPRVSAAALVDSRVARLRRCAECGLTAAPAPLAPLGSSAGSVLGRLQQAIGGAAGGAHDPAMADDDASVEYLQLGTDSLPLLQPAGELVHSVEELIRLTVEPLRTVFRRADPHTGKPSPTNTYVDHCVRAFGALLRAEDFPQAELAAADEEIDEDYALTDQLPSPVRLMRHLLWSCLRAVELGRQQATSAPPGSGPAPGPAANAAAATPSSVAASAPGVATTAPTPTPTPTTATTATASAGVAAGSPAAGVLGTMGSFLSGLAGSGQATPRPAEDTTLLGGSGSGRLDDATLLAMGQIPAAREIGLLVATLLEDVPAAVLFLEGTPAALHERYQRMWEEQGHHVFAQQVAAGRPAAAVPLSTAEARRLLGPVLENTTASSRLVARHSLPGTPQAPGPGTPAVMAPSGFGIGSSDGMNRAIDQALANDKLRRHRLRRQMSLAPVDPALEGGATDDGVDRSLSSGSGGWWLW